MSQRDNFGNGFLLGAIVGGTVGGLIGAILASRNSGELPLDPDLQPLEGDEAENDRCTDRTDRRSLSRRRLDEIRMENARRSLEGKIAQLNEAIDDVRQRFEDSSP